jgi:hypothetical protein
MQGILLVDLLNARDIFFAENTAIDLKYNVI